MAWLAGQQSTCSNCRPVRDWAQVSPFASFYFLANSEEILLNLFFDGHFRSGRITIISWQSLFFTLPRLHIISRGVSHGKWAGQECDVLRPGSPLRWCLPNHWRAIFEMWGVAPSHQERKTLNWTRFRLVWIARGEFRGSRAYCFTLNFGNRKTASGANTWTGETWNWTLS